MSTRKERLVTLAALALLTLTAGLTYAASEGKGADEMRLEPTAEDMAKARHPEGNRQPLYDGKRDRKTD